MEMLCLPKMLHFSDELTSKDSSLSASDVLVPHTTLVIKSEKGFQDGTGAQAKYNLVSDLFLCWIKVSE